MDTPSTPQKRILLVEDDETLMHVYDRILTAEGFLVERAFDGNQGYEKMSHGGYDLVLLDVVLPGTSGMEILEKLKAANLPGKANKKVVLLTNLEQNEYVAKALEYNISGYMIKSDFSPQTFVGSVKKYLEIA